jgi:hypothetical protein
MRGAARIIACIVLACALIGTLLTVILVATLGSKSSSSTSRRSTTSASVPPPVIFLGNKEHIEVAADGTQHRKELSGFVFVHYDSSVTKAEIAAAIANVTTSAENGVHQDRRNLALVEDHMNDQPHDSGPFSSAVSTCFKPLSPGLRIRKASMSYDVYPKNIAGLSSSFIVNNVRAGIQTWDCQTSFSLAGQANVKGDLLTLPSSVGSSPNGKNELGFGPIPYAGVIAVTYTWVDWSTVSVVEWDMVFNDRDYGWTDVAETNDFGKMDFLNILTHEMGHAVATLGDIDTAGCEQVTMYAYASEGETKKRTIEMSDLTGLLSVYGGGTHGICSSSTSTANTTVTRMLFLILCILFCFTS